MSNQVETSEEVRGSHFRLSVMAGLLIIGPLWLTGWLLLKLFVFFDGACLLRLVGAPFFSTVVPHNVDIVYRLFVWFDAAC